MDDALSIFAAERDAGTRIGLVADGRGRTYAELASLTRDRIRVLAPALAPDGPHIVIADNSLATMITLYALLELGVPALLLHPRLTDTERSDQVRAVGAVAVVLPAGAAAVLHTSGTTGTPRAAVLTRGALLASAAASAANLGWQEGDRWLLCMSIARIGGLSILTRCLAARSCVVLADGFDATSFPRRVEDDAITLASLVPTMLHQVLDAHPAWMAPPQLRAILVGGAVAPPALLERAQQRGLPIVLTYGMTETCSQVVATPYAERYAPAGCGTGRALPGAEIRIRDGQIEVRGPMLMAGFLGQAPLAPGAWYPSGDLGALDARGCLTVDARRTDLVVTGGENVYPAEVEGVLEQCPGIAAAGVFGIPDPLWGQVVVAALVAGEDPPDDGMLASHIAVRLAPHKRPRRIVYVASLPHTAAGKPDRAALAALPGESRAVRYPRDE